MCCWLLSTRLESVRCYERPLCKQTPICETVTLRKHGNSQTVVWFLCKFMQLNANHCEFLYLTLALRCAVVAYFQCLLPYSSWTRLVASSGQRMGWYSPPSLQTWCYDSMFLFEVCNKVVPSGKPGKGWCLPCAAVGAFLLCSWGPFEHQRAIRSLLMWSSDTLTYILWCR